MFVPTILAHGGLGNWDEVIFLSTAAIFLIIMGISWVKSRNTAPDFEGTKVTAASSEPDSESHTHIPLE